MGSIKSIKLLLALAGMLLFMWACDSLVNHKSDKSDFPTAGNTPLPLINKGNYKTKTKDINKPVTASYKKGYEINWQKIQSLLERTQNHTGSKFAAFYSLRDSSRGFYFYRTTALSFSPEAVKQANGELHPFLLESARSPESPIEIFVAYIPDSRKALSELTAWIAAKQRTSQQDSSSSQASNILRSEDIEVVRSYPSSAPCGVTLSRIVRYYSGGPPEEGGQLIRIVYIYEALDCSDNGGGGGDPGEGGGRRLASR